jgi:hypothetical protein
MGIFCVIWQKVTVTHLITEGSKLLHLLLKPYSRSVHIFQQPRSHLRILCAIPLTWSKFQDENQQTPDAIVQNLVARTTWRPGIVHPCLAGSEIITAPLSTEFIHTQCRAWKRSYPIMTERSRLCLNFADFSADLSEKGRRLMNKKMLQRDTRGGG